MESDFKNLLAEEKLLMTEERQGCHYRKRL